MPFFSRQLLLAHCFTIASLLVLFTTTASADSIDNLTQRLIELRGDVEELGAELSLQREEHKQAITSLSSQRSDLDARLRREELNQQRLQKELERNIALAREAGADSEQLKPLLITTGNQLEQQIRTGLPFKVAERLADLNEIRDQLATGLLSAPRAANRLWGFYEDEMRLTRENGLYRQTIELNDESLLSDVARLGMVMMYFRTPDKRFGVATRDSGQEWSYTLLEKPADQKRVANLFDSLQKQIRTGFFELPTAI